MGMFYGGLAQIIAGVLEYKKGNTFGTTAFTSYRLFWLSFVALNWLGTANVAAHYVWPFFGNVTPWSVNQEAFAAYFFMFIIFLGTLKTNRALQFVFLSLAILFFLLAAKSALLAYTFFTSADLEIFTHIIGIYGIICGLSAFYLALAEILNEAHENISSKLNPSYPSLFIRRIYNFRQKLTISSEENPQKVEWVVNGKNRSL